MKVKKQSSSRHFHRLPLLYSPSETDLLIRARLIHAKSTFSKYWHTSRNLVQNTKFVYQFPWNVPPNMFIICL